MHNVRLLHAINFRMAEWALLVNKHTAGCNRWSNDDLQVCKALSLGKVCHNSRNCQTLVCHPSCAKNK